MKSHKPFWHAIARISGLAGGAHRKPAAGTARARAARGILVLALALGGVGTAAMMSLGHGAAGHPQASAHHQAGRRTLSAAAAPPNSRPWMY